VTRYRVAPDAQETFREQAGAALEVLTARPGCTSGCVGRAVDDPALWTLTTTWDSVGAYRRALSAYEVKLVVHPLMYLALDEPTAFEPLLTWTPAGGTVVATSSLAADAASVGLGEAAGPSVPPA